MGDRRWAGAYGVDADFVAGDHCSIARIRTHHIQVWIDCWDHVRNAFLDLFPPLQTIHGSTGGKLIFLFLECGRASLKITWQGRIGWDLGCGL